MKLIKLLKLTIFNNLIKILSVFVKKDSKLWLIGMDDGGGVKLSGNSWYLLQYLKTYKTDINVVCVTSDKFVAKELSKINVNYVVPNTFRAMLLALRSSVNFICGELHDEIPNFSKRKTLKIHLWHGVPLKKIFYGSKKSMERYANRSFKMKIWEMLVGRVELEEYDAIIYTSESFKKIMQEAFNNPNVYLTGQPRDDIFYKAYNREELLNEMGLSEYHDYKIVSYLPTFRDTLDKKNNYRIFDKKNEVLKKLEENKILIIQKDHNTILKSREKNGNVIHLTNNVETQKLLLVSDLLITDYSSVYIDYLNLLRPIVFYCYDLEKYTSQDREIYFDYFDDLITPGPKVRTEQDLEATIFNLLDQKANYQNERERSLDFYQAYRDGKNSERVVTLTQKLVSERFND